MTNLQTLNFYATPEHDCSYLQNRIAKTLFVDPQVSIDQGTYSQLSDLGFRRSGQHIYRPHCHDCNACISVRVPVKHFKPSKSQRRIINKNSDLTIHESTPKFTEEYYALYSRYINERHQDGDMYPPSFEQFDSFLVQTNKNTTFYEFRTPDHTLIALTVVDALSQGLSAIYTFFDPDYEKRSLGSYCILWEIEQCQRKDYPYLYLGYWIKNCRKMNYKIAFTPFEFLLNGEWIPFQTK